MLLVVDVGLKCVIEILLLDQVNGARSLDTLQCLILLDVPRFLPF